MPVSADAVADRLLLLAQRDANSLDPLTLQKLVYYAQAFHLAACDSPLFSERIKAWRHGPVIPQLWHRFREYGDLPIDPAEARNPVPDDSDEGRFLAEVWSAFGQLSGSELRERTHSEDPWRNAYDDTPPGERCQEVIPYESMKDYYLDHYEPWQPGYRTAMARGYEDVDALRAQATTRTAAASARAIYSR